MEDIDSISKSEVIKYVDDIKKSGFDKLLPIEREQELSHIILNSKDPDSKECLDAINELVTHNLRLVISIANKLCNQIRDCRALSYWDLVSSGNFGLRRAAVKYDSSKGKFSTYAYYAILREIWGCINDHIFTIRVPKHHRDLISKIYKMEYSSTSYDINGDLDLDFISDQTGSSKKKIERIQKTGKKCNAKSLNVLLPNFDGADTTLMDIVEDPRCLEEFNDTVDFDDKKDILMDNMKHLSPQEQVVLFINVFAHDHYTLDDLKEHLEITKERIRQILIAGTKKLK